MASKRAQLTDEFVAALASDWQQHGVAALEKVREKSPTRYAELIARLVPQEIGITTEPSRFETKAECEEVLAQGLANDVGALERIARRVEAILVERERALPQSAADRRDRERRRQQSNGNSNGPWARSD